MGIKFFNKNLLDIDNESPAITITDSSATDTGESFTDLFRNRDQNTGWMTTDSDDAGNTTIEVDFVDTIELDYIILAGMNFKAYTLKYWDGANFVDFATPVNVSGNTVATKDHNVGTVNTQKLELVITGTMTADEEKFLKEFIVTRAIGELTEQPEVIPEFDRNRKRIKSLSGKSFIPKSVGAFNCTIKKNVSETEADFDLIETLYRSHEGFLVWISGGDESQFETVRQGYRLEDIYLMNILNEYSPVFNNSRWKDGLPIELQLAEVN